MRHVFSLFVTSIILASCGFGTADDDGTAPPAPTPDENARPPVDGQPLTGIFASSSKGVDDADGSMAKPYRKLADAIAVALSAHQRVIACAEEYAEAVEVPDGVSMYGYYDCKVTPWGHVNTRAIVKSPTSPALRVKDAPHEIRIDGFEIVAPNASETATTDASKASSIAALIVNATKLTFGNVVLRAGNGSPGTDGTEGATPVEQDPLHNGRNGIAQSTCVPSPMVTCPPNVKLPVAGSPGGSSKCATGPSGGPGGTGGQGKYIGSPDGLCTVSGYSPHGGAPVATATTALGGDLKLRGTDGTPGKDGIDGANGVFAFDADGFHAGNGTPGTNGAPGQGGGGGGGNNLWNGNTDYCPGPPSVNEPYSTATGAGGGAGGCPGFVGTPGTGGGASIGALLLDSKVTWEIGEIHTGNGGRAGKGTLGTNGLAGGTGGTAPGSQNGATGPGGTGGVGGSGGLSGHGAPGPSIAVAYKGTGPALPQDTQVTFGTGGAGQLALTKTSPGGVSHNLVAVDGLAARTFEIK